MMQCRPLIFSSFSFVLAASGLFGQSSLRLESFSFRQFEGGPPLARGTSLAEGDVIAFECRVAGFQTIPGEFEDKVRLEYQAAILDQQGELLAEKISGKIEVEITPEDKKQSWKPRIEKEFRLPLYLLPGTQRLQVIITDSVSKQQIQEEFPFETTGPALKPSTSISIQNFHFYRTESDTIPLSVPSYRQGDEVWARFLITGFHSQEKKVDLTYGIKVENSDQKLLFHQPVAAEEARQFFHSPGYFPGIISLHLQSDTPKGTYTVSILVTDRLADAKNTASYTFSIE